METDNMVIHLKKGGKLVFVNGQIICYDADGNKQNELTYGQQKFLSRLAIHLNLFVSYNDLFYAYADMAEVATNPKVNNVKLGLPECVKKSIDNKRNVGYRLNGQIENGMMLDELKASSYMRNAELADMIGNNYRQGRFEDLAGTYYGYYLDPIELPDGTTPVLGAYIRIEKQKDSHMKAYAIIGIRDDKILYSESTEEVFSRNETNRYSAFIQYERSLEGNNTRCFYGEGEVEQEGCLALINLRMPKTSAKWVLIFDLEAYMGCTRAHIKDADDCQGGLGLAMALNATHGTRCFRFGIVRQTCWKESINLNNKAIMNQLKLADSSSECVWKPLVLDKKMDEKWHNWLMHQ